MIIPTNSCNTWTRLAQNREDLCIKDGWYLFLELAEWAKNDDDIDEIEHTIQFMQVNLRVNSLLGDFTEYVLASLLYLTFILPAIMYSFYQGW